jgi:hypothetical protein
MATQTTNHAATFSPNPIHEKAREILFDLGMEHEYGQVFAYAALEAMTEVKRPQLYKTISVVNNKLLLEKRMFKNVQGEGYKIALPIEQMHNADSRRMKAGRQLYKGLKEAKYVNLERLSPEEKVRQIHLVNKLANDLSTIRRPAERAVREATTVLRRVTAVEQELQMVKDALTE